VAPPEPHRRDAPLDQPRVRLGADVVLPADRRCADAGHLVAVDDSVDGLPDDFAAQPPKTDARLALLAGAENRCFLPSGQRRTQAWLNGYRPDAAALEVLPGYTHMDVFFGRDAPRDVFPRIVVALAR
jgi:hypothetical protein